MKNFWIDKNVLVTGATGILGSWLTKRLIDEKANVVCLIRDYVPRSNFYLLGLDGNAGIVNGRLEDYFTIERALNEYEIDTAFHLGAQAIVKTANRSPLSTFEANIKGSWNILEAARNSELLERLVIASSDKAYGTQEKLPYTEKDPLQGSHPYDVSKSCVDLIAQSYYRTYGLPLAVARCGNFYGGGDLNFNRIVPGTIKSVLEDKDPVIRSDGTPLRDYFYVLDAAGAYITLAENLDRKDVKGEAFNFGTGKPVTVLEIVKKIIDLSGKTSLEPVVMNEARNEIPAQYLSSDKAKKTLGWQPAYELEKGLAETIDWYKKFLKS
ncbi:MAG: GDP-mannose 4,6-dehydratase [Candidatus Altiarchaeota archaeon]|nr:GDP-mannose 4,6-dehydratase [Candidatus Altiarchaeota archaeon]